MIKRLAAAILGWLLFVVCASAATLLPNGSQTFTDATGAPLSGGRVYFYVPNTTIPKSTWQDSGQTILNSNPVLLNSAGRAVIYGAGTYRQVVKDAYGNTVWDQLTSDGSATTTNWAGTSTGTANAQIVSLASFSQSDGQTISFRAGYTNSGALTLNPNGTGGIPVLRDTLNGAVALLGGEVTVGDTYIVIYDANLGAFHLVASPVSAPFLTIASASTTDIGSLGTPNVTVSGTAAITSFGSSANVNRPVYTVQFSGAASITYNATSMITPTAGNLAMSAGAVVTAVYLGSGNWQILSTGGTPPSMVAFFNNSTCPKGWVAADGTNGTVDMRGYFARGLDTGGTVDPARTLGSLQQDQLQDHTHTYNNPNTQVNNIQGGGTATVNAGFTAGASTGNPNSGNHGTETRPKNVALLACQKS